MPESHAASLHNLNAILTSIQLLTEQDTDDKLVAISRLAAMGVSLTELAIEDC